jgi:hypothetical protein
MALCHAAPHILAVAFQTLSFVGMHASYQLERKESNPKLVGRSIQSLDFGANRHILRTERSRQEPHTGRGESPTIRINERHWIGLVRHEEDIRRVEVPQDHSSFVNPTDTRTERLRKVNPETQRWQ